MKAERREDPTPERLRELVEGGAPGAAAAFAQLAGGAVRAREARLAAARAPLPAGDWWGVFFDVEGDLRGHVAVLLSAGARAALPEPLLVELGNIAASHAVSSVADGIGGRVVLSIPSLVRAGPDRELAWRARRLAASACAARVELGFEDSEGALRALLVLLPEDS